MKEKKEHLNGFEILRFFLGVYIIIYHTFHFPEINNFISRITSMGFIASSTFFILSGFILSYVYLKGSGTQEVFIKDKAGVFLLKRFANLYPIHIFSLALCIGIIFLVSYLNIEPNDINTSNRFVMYDSNNYSPGYMLAHMMDNKELIIKFISNLFLLQAWDPFYLSFNAPSWSISVLFFMYLTFPYLGPKVAKIKSPILVLLIVNIIYISFPIIFSLLNLFDKPFTGFLNRNPIVRFPEFLSGMLICNIYFKFKREKKVINIKKKCLIFIFIILSFSVGYYLLENPQIFTNRGNVSYYLLHTGLLLIPECCLVFLFTTFNIKSEKYISVWKKLGSASLPMFVLHLPLYMLFLRIETLLFKGHPISIYPVFVFLTILVSVYFQNYLVVRTREYILKFFIK